MLCSDHFVPQPETFEFIIVSYVAIRQNNSDIVWPSTISSNGMTSSNQAPENHVIVTSPPRVSVVQASTTDHEDEEPKPCVDFVTCLSWFSCLFCFWPLGCIAVVFALMTSSAVDQPGQLKIARRYSELAVRLSIVSIVCGVSIIIVYLSMSGYFSRLFA
jgi:hypothetical protein